MIKAIISLICILNIVNAYRKKRLASSSSLWVFCYFLIFVLYPLGTSNTYKNGQLIDVCALVGICCYSFGAYVGENRFFTKQSKRRKQELVPEYKSAWFAYWIVFALLIMLMLVSYGSSIFSDVLSGSVTANELTWGEGSANLMIYLMNLMVPFVLAVWICGNRNENRIPKVICLGSFVAVSVLFGYTRLFLICVMAIVLLHEIRRKSPLMQAMIIGIGLLAMAGLMVLLNFIRYLGTGDMSLFFSMLNMDYVFESTDFGASYWWFDELLENDSPYIFPLTYLKPLFVFIPRSVWPGKPDPISLDILRILNPAMIEMGYSTAGNSVLGEGYAICGWIGIGLFPFLWGLICVQMDKNHYRRICSGNTSGLSSFIYYFFTTFVVVSCQRGDWSQYMVIIFWLFVAPLYLIAKIRFKE